jgi:hypothetical protein
VARPSHRLHRDPHATVDGEARKVDGALTAMAIDPVR